MHSAAPPATSASLVPHTLALSCYGYASQRKLAPKTAEQVLLISNDHHQPSRTLLSPPLCQKKNLVRPRFATALWKWCGFSTWPLDYKQCACMCSVSNFFLARVVFSGLRMKNSWHDIFTGTRTIVVWLIPPEVIKMKTAMQGTDEGRLDLRKSVLIFGGAKSFVSTPQTVRWCCEMETTLTADDLYICSFSAVFKQTRNFASIEACTPYCDTLVRAWDCYPPLFTFHCPGLFASGHVYAKRPRTCAFDQRSGGISEISCEMWDWSHQKFWKKLNTAGRCWELLFLLARAPAKCKRKGRLVQIRTGHPCDAKSLVSPQLVRTGWLNLQ